MKSARQGREPSGKTPTEAQRLVFAVRELTEGQFDFWIAALNRAVAAMGGPAAAFSSEDRQKSVSYWYILMYLLEKYAAEPRPFAIPPGAVWSTKGLVAMAALSEELAYRFKPETVRRYVSDLKQKRLLVLEGRGGKAEVKLTAPAIAALVETVSHWMRAFRALGDDYDDLSAAP